MELKEKEKSNTISLGNLQMPLYMIFAQAAD